MVQSNKRDIPAYVYTFIKIHVARLIRSRCFNIQEQEDLKQDFWMFYFDAFPSGHLDKTEGYIFMMFRLQSNNMLRGRIRALKSGGTQYSLNDLEENGIEISDETSLSDIDDQIAFKEVMQKVSPKEAEVIKMVLEGYNLAEIIKELHVSYAVISRICEKVKKN